MILRRLFFAFNVLIVITLLLQGGTSQIGKAASPVILEGTFTLLWGDGIPGSGETRSSYFLSTGQYGSIQLIIDEGLLTLHGGPLGFNQKAVILQGAWLEAGAVFRVQSIALANGQSGGIDGVYGPQPWVSILCKFSDNPDEPKDLDYFLGMYSNVYPGLDHFWQQNSYTLVNLEGSGAFGWYVLPFPRSHYVPPSGNMDWDAAAKDCTGAADPYVDFSQYVGINLMFNAVLDCCAWGGQWWLCLDGKCEWRMTWEPPWGYENIGVIGHETGHGFGLPHSLGNCQQGYDNRWDVMSDLWDNGDPDPIYGITGQHTISYHKEILGWVAPEQIYTATVGTLDTITLERLSLPQTGNYLGARIPIDGQEDHFYTLEVRQPTANPIDYDKWLPGFAVIIHEVDENLPEPATVIDKDGDCDTGDAGAMFLPGEMFTDTEHGIMVSIDSATDTGYVVTVNNRFTSMESVELTGTGQGYLGDSIPFTATVSPSEATSPITYTWEATGLPPAVQVGDTVNSIDFSWDEVGTKAITVTSSNAGGTVVDTHLVDITQKIPMVTLSGPEIINTGVLKVYTATVVPTDVVLPISYAWEASRHMPITHTTGISDSISYAWEDPGIQVITVTATNIDGATTDTISLTVRMPPINVEINGPAVGDVQTGYKFTAIVNPITTTVPIDYIWTIDDQSVITHTAGITDAVTLTWDTAGLHQLSVSATNPAGIVIDTWSITIYVRIFLPFSMRN